MSMKDTWPLLDKIPFPPIRREALQTLQVNVGYRCNQSCVHCHVNAGPNRISSFHVVGGIFERVFEDGSQAP